MKRIAVIFITFSIFLWPVLTMAQEDAARRAILDDLRLELEELKKELPEIRSKDTGLEDKQIYVEKVIKLREKILQLEEEGDTGKDDSAISERGVHGAPLFILSEIKLTKTLTGYQEIGITPKEYEYTPGSTGYTARTPESFKVDPADVGRIKWDRPAGVVAATIKEFPETIRLGESFNVSVEKKYRADYPKESTCHLRSWSSRFLHSRVSSSFSPSVYFKGKNDLNLYCDEGPIELTVAGVYRKEDRTKFGPFTKQDSLVISVESVFVEARGKKDKTPRYFDYKVNVTSGGKLATTDYKGKIRTTDLGPTSNSDKEGYKIDKKLLSRDITIAVDRFLLIYKHAERGDQPKKLASYSLPPDFDRPPLDGQKVADDSKEVKPDDGDSPDEKDIARKDDDEKDKPDSKLSDKDKTAAGADDGADPARPHLINPNHPKVAGFIKEWLGSAEPPANVTDGANLRYNEWGQVEGTTPGGIMKSTRKPDFNVWDIRDKLDSVDHCTLGEYVLAKLGDKPTGSCSGRYKPKVHNVSGMSKKSAEKKLKSFRLKTKIRPGKPAPDKNKSLKVERTEPEIGSTVNRGDMVTLYIHTPYVDLRTVPDLTGLSAKKIKKELKKRGLEGDIKLVKAATEGQSGRIKSQDPPPETRIKAGTTVKVEIFGPFIRMVKIPGVEGRPEEEAMKKLRAAGLKVKVLRKDPTEKSSLAGTVRSQRPRSGVDVKKGETVELVVFMTLKETCGKWPGTSPVRNKKTNQIECMCSEGYLWVSKKNTCLDKKTALLEKVNCSKWPGSKPDWDVKDQKYYCECIGDYEWNNSNTACRLKKSVQVARTDCSIYGSNSEARWSSKDERALCYCKEGYGWNKKNNYCVKKRSRKEIALANKKCPPCEKAYWNEKKQYAYCGCDYGCSYDASIANRCLPDSEIASLRRKRLEEIKAKDEAEKQRYCRQYLSDLRNSVSRKEPPLTILMYETIAINAGCNMNDIQAARRGGGSGYGGGGGGRTKTKVQGRGRVSTPYVNICVTDSNSVLDDHYDMYVNNIFIGAIRNPKGGRTCYNANLYSGSNRIELRLTRKMGKSTALTMNINNNEFKKGFSGSHNHVWEIEAP